MCGYAWPGNVRELRNAAERATFRTMAAQANGSPLGPVTLSADLLDPFNSPWRPAKDLSAPLPSAPPQPAATMTVETISVSPPNTDGPVDFNSVVAELEKKLIGAALETCRGHQKKAAEYLGLSYHQMRGLLRKYGYGREGAASQTENSTAESVNET
jgi:psp operon transcriptional activator